MEGLKPSVKYLCVKMFDARPSFQPIWTQGNNAVKFETETIFIVREKYQKYQSSAIQFQLPRPVYIQSEKWRLVTEFDKTFHGCLTW